MFIFTRALFGFQREKYPLEEWIESGEREAAIDPEFPVVDPHHHLWDARTQDKGWPVSSLMIKFLYALKPSIMVSMMVKSQDPDVISLFSSKLPAATPYMANEMLRDMENTEEQGDQPLPSTPTSTADSSATMSHNIVGTVYIESGWSCPKATCKAMEAVPEVAMAQGVASSTKNRLCTGIVGHVPLGEGAEDVRRALTVMVNENANCRGIRDELAFRKGLFSHHTKTKDKAYDAQFRSGFAVLSEFNLSYDTWLYQDNLPALKDLAVAFPGTTIICDHVGGPASVGEPSRDVESAFQSWAPSIKELADSCPNVMVKLSGLGMASVGFGFEHRPTPPTSAELSEAWGPYILHCIECFGVDRCMFASNFPVDKISCSYTALFNAFKIIVKDFSAEDKKKLFHDNAVRIYRLKIAA